MKLNLSKLIKKEIIINVITISFTVITLFGFSYGYFTDLDEAEPNAINFGNIGFALCADNTCSTITTSGVGNIIGIGPSPSNPNITEPITMYPMSDTDGLNSAPYKFILKNTGDYDLTVKIYLKPDSTFNLGSEFPNYSTYTIANHENIKIALHESGTTKPSAGTTYNTISATGNNQYVIGSGIVIPKNTEKVFDLYIWVKNDVLNEAQGTYFVATVSAKGEYVPSIT